jgi:Tfp pilus assembly protein PilN
MIEINLARKKSSGGGTRATRASSAPSFGFLKGLSGGAGKSLGPLVTVFGVPLALGLAADFGYDYLVEEKLTSVRTQVEDLTKEKEKVELKMKEIQGYEPKKRLLEANEAVIRTKIETIEKLIRNRDFTAKTLIALSQSLPKEVWITEMNQGESSYEIKGSTLDIGLISELMTRLGKSIYFKDVQLRSSGMTDSSGAKSDFVIGGGRD